MSRKHNYIELPAEVNDSNLHNSNNTKIGHFYLSTGGTSEWSLSATIIRNESTFDYSDKLLLANETNINCSIQLCTNNLSTINMVTDNSLSGENSAISTHINHSSVDIASLKNPFYWSEIILIICFCLFIVITVIGNTLVILSVITTRRLRTVTNCFVMSLAVADWLVGLFVMPPAVLLHITGKWRLGWMLCELWISLDVLLCTASILSLCAISIDRYLAVTQPLNYSRRRRSKRLALTMILIVWILALAITCPPLIGWYEPGRREQDDECRYNENKGYVVFSAMGSFFIPMTVMIYVYLRISCVIARRHDQMAEIEVHKKTRIPENYPEPELGDSSENDQCPISPTRRKVIQDHKLPSLNNISDTIDTDPNNHKHNKNGHYELMDISTPNSKRSSTLTYKISGSSENWPISHQRQQSVRSNEFTSKNIRVHQKSISTRITSMKRENKTTQTLSIVVGGFIACWLPFFIVYLLTPFVGHETISDAVKSFLTWLGWVNSAINPFIYAFYSVDFRAAFWRLTLRRFFKNRKPPYATNNMSIRR